MLVVSEHARQRMQQRGITEDELSAAWNRRTTPLRPGSRPGTMTFEGVGDGRSLVIVVTAGDHRFVVTVWEA